jgi:hypothetical protein
MKGLWSVKRNLLISCCLFSVINVHGQSEVPKGNSVSGKIVPDYQHIPYCDEKPYNNLNIYIAEGTKDGPPNPLYVWAHPNGGSLDDFSRPAITTLSQAGISSISWASVAMVKSFEDYKQCMIDFEKVMDFIIKKCR